MIALIDVELMAHELNFGEGGHYGDDPEDAFRAVLKKTALYYFEKGTAPDAVQAKLTEANEKIQEQDRKMEEMHKEMQALRQTVLKLQRRPSDLPKVQAERVQHARYECEKCHKHLRIRYAPGVLTPADQPEPEDVPTGDCPYCGGAVVPAPKAEP